MANLIGSTPDPQTPGVLGENTNNTNQAGVGIYGKSAAAGVLGESTTWHGVAGLSKSTTGGAGVFGQGLSGNFGVLGESTTGAGVEGRSQSGPGVFAQSNAAGVWGKSETWMGVFGETQSTTGGAGVMGEHKNGGVGVLGVSEKDNGVGVLGKGKRLAGLFEGNVEITGFLTIQGVNLIQRVQQLEQQVQMLSSQVSELMRNRPTGETAANFAIDVTVTQSEVKVTGQGFRPSVKCFILVVYPDFTRKVLEETADSSGKLNFNTSISTLCIPGLTLTLNFTVNQPDTSGRDKFTNTVSKSISC